MRTVHGVQALIPGQHTGKGRGPSGREFPGRPPKAADERMLWALGTCKGSSGKLILRDIYLVASDYELTFHCKLLFPISWLIRKCAQTGSLELGCRGNFDTQIDFFFLNSLRHSFPDSSFLTGNTMSPFSSVFPGLLRTWPLRQRRKKGRSRGCGGINSWLIPLPAFPELICLLWIPGHSEFSSDMAMKPRGKGKDGWNLAE